MDDADEHKKELRKMLSLNEVLAIVPIARSTLLRMVRLKQFPQPIHISENRRVWYADQIIAWQEQFENSQHRRRRGPGRPRVKGVTAAETAPALFCRSQRTRAEATMERSGRHCPCVTAPDATVSAPQRRTPSVDDVRFQRKTGSRGQTINRCD